MDSGEYVCLLTRLYCMLAKFLSEFRVVAVYAALFSLKHCVYSLVEQYIGIEV